MGASDGVNEGRNVGATVVALVGGNVGDDVGDAVGTLVRVKVGVHVGRDVFLVVGFSVGELLCWGGFLSNFLGTCGKPEFSAADGLIANDMLLVKSVRLYPNHRPLLTNEHRIEKDKRNESHVTCNRIVLDIM